MTAPVRNMRRQHYNGAGEPKVAYPTKRDARAAADMHSHGRPSVYRCGHCNMWHLGNLDDGWRAAPPKNHGVPRSVRRRLDSGRRRRAA
jgi:hypothetical protein